MWHALFPSLTERDIKSSVVTTSTHPDNELNLALLEVSGSLLALNGITGELAWQWRVPYNITVKQVSGWGDTVALLLNGQPIINPYTGIASSPTYLVGLDASSGELRWQKNGTEVLVQTQSDLASYSLEFLVAGKGIVVFSRGSRLGAVNATDGTMLWRTSLALEGSVGTGQGANITHVVYLPDYCNRPCSEVSDYVSARLLINANNWSFQRFALMVLNHTNVTGKTKVALHMHAMYPNRKEEGECWSR